jgi:myo-inositol-1(or 4)-monophosphatase
MPNPTLQPILEEVRAVGQMALQAQLTGVLESGIKADGTVVTQVDVQVEERLHARIAAMFPQVNFVTEETARDFDPRQPDAFVIDPIDGTEAFSMGMPGWCVSVGLMRDYRPIAGVLYSPRLDLFLLADVGQAPSLNGRPLPARSGAEQIGAQTNIMVSSSLHRQVELARFPGKIRNQGSAALQLVYPLIYPGIFAAVEGSGTHIWDLLAAHALCLAHGMVFEYLDGSEFEYENLIGGGNIRGPVLAGYRERVEKVRAVLMPCR